MKIVEKLQTALLSQDLINENRGVVWFVEKNRETASSEYNRGDSFGLHKNLSDMAKLRNAALILG